MDYSTMHFCCEGFFSEEYLSYCMPFVPRYAILSCCKQVVFSTFYNYSYPMGFILLLCASLWSFLFYSIFLSLYLPNGKDWEQFSGLLISHWKYYCCSHKQKGILLFIFVSMHDTSFKTSHARFIFPVVAFLQCFFQFPSCYSQSFSEFKHSVDSWFI